MLNNWEVLRKNSLVHIIKFFDDSPREIENFSGRYLKTGLQNHINNLSSLTAFQDVWLNNAEGTIVQNSCRFHHSSLWRPSEEEIKFSSSGLWRVTTMHSIFGSIASEKSSKGTRSLHLSLCGISWADEIPPFLDGTLGD